jgi:hypothetical protein
MVYWYYGNVVSPFIRAICVVDNLCGKDEYNDPEFHLEYDGNITDFSIGLIVLIHTLTSLNNLYLGGL